jgi:pilus assembly protein CpaF
LIQYLVLLLDLLIALNSSFVGHVRAAREFRARGADQMCTLPLLTGENVSAAFVVPTVAASVELVVHLGTDASGHRRVREIITASRRRPGTAWLTPAAA